MDKVFDQFSEYQSIEKDLEEDYPRIDHMWHYLGNLKGCDGFRFNLLFEVVKYILLLPHSNAEEERIFSMVAKNKTKFRARLSNETTLPSILSMTWNVSNSSPQSHYLKMRKKQLCGTMLITLEVAQVKAQTLDC